MATKKRQAGPSAAPAAPPTLLGKARWMLESGDVRRARQYAQEAANTGAEAERAEARALLDRLAPDRRAMLAAAFVLLLILLATWAAILRTR